MIDHCALTPLTARITVMRTIYDIDLIRSDPARTDNTREREAHSDGGARSRPILRATNNGYCSPMSEYHVWIPGPERRQRASQSAPQEGLSSWLLRIFAVFLLASGARAAWCGGFLHFADTVAPLTPPENPKADAIVVLTGTCSASTRPSACCESGTGQPTSHFRRPSEHHPHAIREMTRAPKSLFDCCIDIGYSAIDTIGNAIETAALDQGARLIPIF